MAERVFTLNTEPHRAVIGDTVLLFQPEAVGTEFIEAYVKVQDMHKRVKAMNSTKASSTKHAKDADVDAGLLAEVAEGMRGFLRTFMLPESVPVFDGLRLPDRILVQLMEFTAELYGGGSGNPGAAGGTSSG